ncbi:hypothetical protein CWN67_01295 [Klebsiella pneumoniae]|nr:hypothetical protein CWN67_01295 [Klebsiella pneumoniae]PLO02856.1 hypothetical protein CWM94_00410 [Klebsiella pneumoniae]
MGCQTFHPQVSDIMLHHMLTYTEVFMKNHVDIKLQRLIRARYNAAFEIWSESKWLEIGPGVATIYLG